MAITIPLTLFKKKNIIERYNSIQIWYTANNVKNTQPNIPKPSLEIDINIWRLKKKFGRQNYLDIGLKIINGETIDSAFLYFPFEILDNEISDLGVHLKDQQLLNGIFNENFSADNKNKLTVIKKNDIPVFEVYELQMVSNERKRGDITLSQDYNGTTLSFKVNYKKNKKYYRFRVTAKSFGNIFETFKPKNSFFESAFTETEIVDLRLNEKRNQDKNLLEIIDENCNFNIERVNFFLISPMKDEIIINGANLQYQRQLEDGNFWKNYLAQSYERMSVYKYKMIANANNTIDHFGCFFKVQYRKANLITIFQYLLVLSIITISINLVSNYLYDYLKHLDTIKEIFFKFIDI